MDIKLNNKNFSHSLKIIGKIFNLKSSNQLREQMIKLKAKDNKLIIEASCSNSIRITLDNVEINKEGEIVVDWKMFNEIFSRISNEDVFLSKVDSNFISVKSGEFKLNLNILDSISFPDVNYEIDNSNEIVLYDEIIKKAIEKVSHACASQININQPYEGICIQSSPLNKEKTLVLATDNCRFACQTNDFNINTDKKFIFYPDILNLIYEINKNNKEIKFLYNNEKILWKIENCEIITKIIYNTFPDVNFIFNFNYLNYIILEKKKILEALERINVLFTKYGSKTSFNIKNKELSLESSSYEKGFSSEKIEVDSKKGNDIKMLFNTYFFISVLKIFDCEKIKIEYNSSTHPIKITSIDDENFFEILVPTTE